MDTHTTTLTCETCGFFIPHYVRINRKFTLCGLGHCTYAVAKPRKTEATACPHYHSRT